MLAWLPLAIVVGAWALSYVHAAVVQWSADAGQCYFLVSDGGRLAAARQSISPGVPPGPFRADATRLGRLSIASDDQGSAMMSFDPDGVDRTFLGFATADARGSFGIGGITPSSYRAEFTLYAAPYWAIAGLAALPPVLVLVRRRRTLRRLRFGRCTRCGYDLRATPGRCPECGAVPGADPAATPAPG